MIKHTTTASFEEDVLKSDVPVLVDFWATWCGPCKMLAPVLEQVDQEANGKYQVCKVDIDENSALAEQFKVMSIPTIIVFKNGKPAKTSVGLIPKEQVISLLNIE
ncbi:MAG: thioredoxin [Oscillospiraceae bacterium]